MSSVSDPSAGGYDPFLVRPLVTSRHADLPNDAILIPQNAISLARLNAVQHRIKWATLICYGCGDLVHFKQSCSNKFCPSCFSTRARRVHRDANDLLRLMLTPKFVTLTYGRHELSFSLIKQLRHDLNRLLHRRRFRRAIDGGFYWIELGEVREDLTCNIHIHMMIGADYIPFDDLSSAWEEITGYPRVSIQKVNDAHQGAFYINKYCAKPVKGEDSLSWPLKQEINEVLKHVRMIQTFGDCSLPRSPSRCAVCGLTHSFISVEHDLEPAICDLLERSERSDWVRLQRKPIAEALERWVTT